ncbi:MAG: polysaccharide deacetylase, partial [Oscillospiraceae bacterium]|nr:polysaccharide deacetylase [Oscillospiraceae bacterium]
SKPTLEVVKEIGFRCSMVCEERINRIEPGNPDSLYNLGRFNRPSGKPTESFFARLLENK